MKKIIIVRHAKSDWLNGVADFDRSLSEIGIRVAPKMGEILAEMKAVPDYVICSSARRTTETAELLLTNLYDFKKVKFLKDVYEASFYELLNLINNDVEDSINTLMLIGHNPGVTELVEYLSAANIGWLSTCSCVSLTLSVDSWKMVGKDTLSMNWYIYPKMFNL